MALGSNLGSRRKTQHCIKHKLNRAHFSSLQVCAFFNFFNQTARSDCLRKNKPILYNSIVQFIRSVLEYCTPTFHHSLSKYLSEDLERVQKRAMSIIAPSQSYKQSLDSYGLCTLRQRRDDDCSKLFGGITKSNDLSLAHLLPPRQQGSYSLRSKKTFNPPQFHTNRFKNSFIPARCQRVNSNVSQPVICTEHCSYIETLCKQPQF